MFYTIALWIMLGLSGNFSSVNVNLNSDGYGIGGAPAQRMVTTDGYGIGGAPVQRPVTKNGYGIGG